MDKFKIKQLDTLFTLNLSSQTYQLKDTPQLFKVEVNMANVNIYKGEKYPITISITPAESTYSNFSIESIDVDIKNKTGKSIDVYGETSIDSVNKVAIFSWDTSQYNVNTYIIVIWVTIMYNGTEFKLCTGNLSKTIRDIDILDQV